MGAISSDGGVVGGLDPFAGGAVDGPGGGGGEEFGGGCWCRWVGGRIVADTIEQHGADYGYDGRLHVWGELAG